MKKFKTFTLFIFIVSLCVPSVMGQAAQRNPRPMLRNQLQANPLIPDLTEEQKQQLKTLREEQKDIQNQYMDRTRNLNQQLDELRQDVTANADEIEKIRDEIFNLKIEQMRSTYEFQKKMNKVFTPEQLEKMSIRRRLAQRGRAAINRRSSQQRQFPRMRQSRGRGPMMGRNRFPQRGMGWRRR